MRLWAWLLQHWGTVSGMGAAASGVIALLWRKLRPWYRRFMEAYKLMLQLPGIVGASESDRRLLQEIAATVEMIRKQVQPNGGASIPDSLRRVETELAHSRVVQQEMVSQTGVAMWQSSADGACIWASPALADLLNIDGPRVLGNGWASAVHQEDRSRVQEEWKSAVREWRPFEESYKTRGGIKVQARANPLPDGSGFIGTLRRLEN